jgi:acylphosphatase
LEKRSLYRMQIRGMVQGVGFRWGAAREAWRTGVTGYVKNMSDGSVYIEAEGTRAQLETFSEWCRRGPGAGTVDSVEINESPTAGYSSFTIEH